MEPKHLTIANLPTDRGGVRPGSILENVRRADLRHGTEGPKTETGAWAFFDYDGERHRIDYEMFSKTTRSPESEP